MILSRLIDWNHLTQQILKHSTQITWQTYTNWNFLEFSTIFESNWSTFVIKNWHLSHQKAHQTTPSVVVESFQSSNPWKGWSVYKNCVVKNKNVKKVRFFYYFGVHVAILFFYKTAFISANNPIGQRNLSWLKVFNVLIHEILRSLTKVACKREKSVHFEVIVIFGRKLFVFFFKKLRLFPKKRSCQPICF